MTTERPHYLPPLSVRPEADREPEIPAPQPRTASSATTATTGGNLSRSTSAASRSRSRTGHAPRSPSGYSNNFALPSSSTTGGPPYSAASPPSQGTSTTHAGGILPAASFFHPSRPAYYTDFGPSTSFTTPTGGGPPGPPIPLTSIPRAFAHGEARPESIGSDSFAHSVVTTEEYTGPSNRERSGSTSNNALGPNPSSLGRSFSTKVSREPLLPIGPKPKPTVPAPHVRPSASGTSNSSATRLPGVGGYSRWGEGSSSKDDVGSNNTTSTPGRARNSLEKFLRRTATNDAQMASDITFAKNAKFSPSLEDLEARPREYEEPFVEFKAAPGVILDDGETLDITRNATMLSSMSRRQRNAKGFPRFRNFNPVPPAIDPPASRTPLLDPKGKPMRKHELHPSRNTFFLKGKILTGGDSAWPFLCSVVIVFGLAGTWSGTTAVWWWKNESPAVAIIGAYMCLLSIANMAATAFSDPGILPRNLDPDPPYSTNSSHSDLIQPPLPLPRDLKVRSGVVRVKYCQTCRIYRPPRSSHCRMCDNCVDGCDHHCQWVNNCVGRRNYTSFILFLTFGTLTLCLFICTSAIHLVLQAHKEHIRAKESLRKGAGSAVVFVISSIVIWPVLGLLMYHMRLLLLNLTTIEQIRNSAHRSLNEPTPPNPFGLGNWRQNLGYMLCRSRGMSWISASEVATEDKREPNPGSEVKAETN